MAYEHSSGLPGVYERGTEKPLWQRVLFREAALAQAAELMDMQGIIERRGRRISDRVLSDGNRVDGAEIIVDADAELVTLTAGKVYLRGDVRDVPAAVLSDVPMTGDVSVGLRLTISTVTEEEDPSLLGLHPGSDAEGEPGAGREAEVVAWGFSGDGGEGDLYQVYQLSDGVPLDQTEPPIMEPITQALALYDRDAHGSYVVRGCKVTALGKVGAAQQFSIAEGVANILGFKRSRSYSLRHSEIEDFDVETVDAEPHTFDDGGSGTVSITVNHGPINAVTTAIITKETTSTLTKGTTDGTDPLPESSVTLVSLVDQGGTTYTEGVDFQLSGDAIDWSLAGAEPLSGSSYDVTFQYLDAVTPDEVTDDEVTLSGGVTGGTVLLSYSWKLPRTDLLCLDRDGATVYVNGVSSVGSPKAPAQPSSLLALAAIFNDWRGTPTVENTQVRSVPYDELWHYLNRLFEVIDLVALERLKSDIDNREPVAKRGVFVDPLEDDTYRDLGETQTAAVYDGELQLPIEVTTESMSLSGAALLDWTEEVLIKQQLITGSMLVNPYQNFEPIPAALSLDPAVDFWTRVIEQTRVTQSTSLALLSRNGTVTTESTSAVEFLRQIDVDFSIEGFVPGEALTTLTFDGINVTPVGLTADANGEISGTFEIPDGVLAGTKIVVATGSFSTTASASFTGAGEITVRTILRVLRPENEGNGGGADPLAQTFALTESRQVVGVDLHCAAIGDASAPLVIEVRSVENGIPTSEVLAAATVDMFGVTVGSWFSARFDFPVLLQANIEYAFVVKTNDPDHAVSTASLGEFDTVAQRWVTSQPYAIGVLLSSSNATTWTPHQSEDLAFRIIGARFAPTTKTVALGSFAVTSLSDLRAKVTAEMPSAATSVVIEVELPDGSITRLLPDQLWKMTSYVTGTVIARAILTGTAKLSPVVYPGGVMLFGSLQASGVYISRAFNLGTAIRMSAFMKTKLPAGSTLTVEIDGGDDNWTAVAQYAAETINEGWIEREYRVDPYTNDEGRLRLTLTGTPAARPYVSDLRAVAI